MGLFDKFKKKPAETAQAPAPVVGPIRVLAPVAGRVIPMSEVPDPAFGGEMLGKGCAVWPEGGRVDVVSPVSGTVTVVMPHAIGLVSDDGAELLVHVGIDTVSMRGEGFTGRVAQGEHVAAGALLLAVDLDAVATAGHKDCVVIAVSNSASYAEVRLAAAPESSVAVGDAVLELVK